MVLTSRKSPTIDISVFNPIRREISSKNGTRKDSLHDFSPFFADVIGNFLLSRDSLGAWTFGLTRPIQKDYYVKVLIYIIYEISR